MIDIKIFLKSTLLLALSTCLADERFESASTGQTTKNETPQLLTNGNLNNFSSERIDYFIEEFNKPIAQTSTDAKNIEILDQRIAQANLNLPEKIAVFKRLSPDYSCSDEEIELRMVRIILSVPLTELALFKFALEYDGDDQDMEAFVFHHINHKDYQQQILRYLQSAPQNAGIKVLTDVDDTLYANLIDKRYPAKTVYPGVMEFYAALKSEPFQMSAIPVTLLSARPNLLGIMEEENIEALSELSEQKLAPSALSGETISSIIGTLQTLWRSDQDYAHNQEDRIAQIKFENFRRFAKLYPDYHFVFVGDSGQADALTAKLMLTESTNIMTTFIHALNQTDLDSASNSDAFTQISKTDFVVQNGAKSGRGIIIFRNYIQAATIAYQHSATLGELITATKLLKITLAALSAFEKIAFSSQQNAAKALQQQYKEDAEIVLNLLKNKAFDEENKAELLNLKRVLSTEFWQKSSAA